jgi:hypothetical protein
MAKPNRVFANMPKRPFELVATMDNMFAAEDKRDELKAQGFDAKVTSYVYGSRRRPSRAYNVWKREKA